MKVKIHYTFDDKVKMKKGKKCEEKSMEKRRDVMNKIVSAYAKKGIYSFLFLKRCKEMPLCIVRNIEKKKV